MKRVKKKEKQIGGLRLVCFYETNIYIRSVEVNLWIHYTYYQPLIIEVWFLAQVFFWRTDLA